VVAQAIPVFAMIVFKIPKNICKEITDAISKLWWGDDDDHNSMHRLAWWKMCIPKGRGGMDFETCIPSTWRCSQSNAGDCWRTQTLSVRGFKSKVLSRRKSAKGKASWQVLKILHVVDLEGW
jgi:hypothetical protein